jgi:1-acyl-sn-glycerol-3-phosphate acyltransferase
VADRVFGDLVEHHPADGHLRLQHLDEVPGDRLSFAVFVRREQQLVRARELLLEVGDDLLLVGVDDVERFEAVLDVDAEPRPRLFLHRGRDLARLVGEVADVTDARGHVEAVAEVAGDRPRLRGRLDDHQAALITVFRAHRHWYLFFGLIRPCSRLNTRDTLATPPVAAVSPDGGYWPHMPAPKRPSWLYLLIGGLSVPLVRLFFRLRARGLENLPREGGYVLAANHTSNFDPWPLGLPLFPRRFLRFMAKSELFFWPLGPLIAACGAFKVRRGERDAEAIAAAEQLCRQGYVVVMFPEGTRRTKGLRKKWEARAHTGAARIALSADVPLVPAAIRGTDRLARLGPLRVVYGPPVPIDDLRDQDVKEAAEIATDRLMTAIHELEATL